MKERIRQAQARLQAAAASGDYEEAARALDELLETVEEAVQGRFPPEDLLPEVTQGLERARRLILAARAHDAARLARMNRLPPGYGTAIPVRSSIQLEG